MTSEIKAERVMMAAENFMSVLSFDSCGTSHR